MQIYVHKRKVINIFSNVHYVSLVILRIKKDLQGTRFFFCNRGGMARCIIRSVQVLH
jgi:hypothetical protein